MTEDEWLTATDPTPMLGFLQRNASDRKLRLFAVVCIRAVSDVQTDPQSRLAIETAESFADELVREEDLRRSQEAAAAVLDQLHANASGQRWQFRDEFLAEAVVAICTPELSEGDVGAVASNCRASRWIVVESADVDRVNNQEARTQTGLIHEIFGNPFRPVNVDFAWRTSTVIALAEGIYREKAFDRFPILADALMDAGCDNLDILSHCQSEGPHVRGCWVIDAVLGKE